MRSLLLKASRSADEAVDSANHGTWTTACTRVLPWRCSSTLSATKPARVSNKKHWRLGLPTRKPVRHLAGQEVNPQAARRPGQSIERHFALLEASPDIGRPFPELPQLCELIIAFGDSGYVALYRHDLADGAVYVLAFRHQKEAGHSQELRPVLYQPVEVMLRSWTRVQPHAPDVTVNSLAFRSLFGTATTRLAGTPGWKL